MAAEDHSKYYGVPLHPECARMNELRNTFPRRGYQTMILEEARSFHLQNAIALCGHYDFKGSVTDLCVPSDQLQGGIPIRVYKPANVTPDSPILVYFHGDGMVLGSIEAYEVCCKMLADRSQCIIVSVEHRLAPEHPLPAGLDDCDNVARWILQNKTEIGGTKNSVVGVGGDGWGGKAASLCPHYVPGLGFQVLIYPSIDERLSFPSYMEYDELKRGGEAKWFHRHHQETKNLPDDKRFNPIQQSCFDHLPPAIFIVAEIHIRRDDSVEYEKTLKDAGVQTGLHLMKGTFHDFFHIPGFYKELCDKTYGLIADFINGVIKAPPNNTRDAS